MKIQRGLIVGSPFIDNIIQGKKIWEIRGSQTKVRGEIALIRSGSGLIIGSCELVDVIGPLTLKELQRNAHKACKSPNEIGPKLPYMQTYAWVLTNPRSFMKPIPYNHPVGAVIWVRLSGHPDFKL
jgi:hypothetical protein